MTTPTPPFCKDCRHLSCGDYCSSPGNGISKVTGKPVVRFAWDNRSIFPSAACGPEGKLFEPKVSLWSKIKADLAHLKALFR